MAFWIVVKPWSLSSHMFDMKMSMEQLALDLKLDKMQDHPASNAWIANMANTQGWQDKGGERDWRFTRVQSGRTPRALHRSKIDLIDGIVRSRQSTVL